MVPSLQCVDRAQAMRPNVIKWIALLTFVTSVESSVYDVIMPEYTSTCRNGCLPWANAAKLGQLNLSQQEIDNMFVLGVQTSTAAGTSCAMPGGTAGTHEKDCGLHCDPNGLATSLSRPFL